MTALGSPDSQIVVDTLSLSVLDKLIALAGGGQSKWPIANQYGMYRFATVASNNDSMTLPPGKLGTLKIVVNADASHSLNVFPAVGEAINALGANSAFAVASNKVCIFICTGPGQWHSITTA